MFDISQFFGPDRWVIGVVFVVVVVWVAVQFVRAFTD